MQRITLALALFIVCILAGCSTTTSKNVSEKKNTLSESDMKLEKENQEYLKGYKNYNDYTGTKNSLVVKKIKDPAEYIIPDSDKKIITTEVLDNLEKSKLDYARNEIYARHGYDFKSKKYKDYFMGKYWYSVNKYYSEDSFNDIERKNLEIINAYENSLKKQMTEVSSNYGKYDLDNNGVKDKITLVFQDNSTKFTLNVDTQTFTQKGINFKNTMFIYDIDSTDNYTEIAIVDETAKNTYSTSFYRYDGNKISCIGTVSGCDDSIKIIGNGKVVTSEPSHILPGWVYGVTYNLKGNVLVKYVPDSLYDINSKVTLKENLTVQKSQSDSKVTFVIKKDEEVTLLKSDDLEWISVENSKGDIGWIKFTEPNKLNGKTVQEVLSTLKS